MSYRKPKFVIKSGETCDPQQINENIQPAAQELSGHVIDHNVTGGTFPQSRVTSACYYAVANGGTPYYIEVASDMQITTGGTGAPIATDPNCWRVPDTAEWSPVGSLARTVVTGESVLWVIAQVQYGLVGLGGVAFSDKPNLQFAIRVDGIVLDDTPTGLEDPVNPADRQYYPPLPADRSGAGPYSIHTFSTPNCEALGFPVYPVRLLSFCPVDEGTHTIEIVARRLPLGPGFDGAQYVATPVYCFNRKLLVVDMHLQAPATGSTYSVEVAAVSEGDPVNVASTYTNTVAAVVASENDLGDGAMARNALRNVHLPSRVQTPNNVGLVAGNNTATVYPGYGAQGVAGGWILVDNGAGSDCKTNNGPYDFAVTPGFVILLGNVAVSNISVASPYDQARTYAWFTVQLLHTSGAAFGRSATEMAISNPNLLNILDPTLLASGGDFMDPIEADVPLFEFFDYRTAPPAGGAVSDFRVLGGNSYRGGGGVCTVNWRKSNIALIGLKP